MSDRFDGPHTLSDLDFFFPVSSQTTSADKLFLLGAMRLARRTGAFSYLEIGSFRGGSLTPFLMDGACKLILSIDDRGRVLSDERGINLDYTGITSRSMLDELQRKGMRIDKLKTFDGSVNELNDNYSVTFDLAFIDGEHTDEACIRDFLWTLPLMKSDSIIMFHDSPFIYKALKIIMIYLDKINVEHTLLKGAHSLISAIILGSYRSNVCTAYLGAGEDLSTFFARSEEYMIRQQFKNRMRVRFFPRRMLKLRSPLGLEVRAPKSVAAANFKTE